MRFSIISALVAFVTLAAANTIEFVNQDSTTRTIIFTANAGLETIPSAEIRGHHNHTTTFPTGWIGNFYSVSKGSEPVPGMLGEVAFDGYAGSLYFDVSAIVNPEDTNGVKELFPKLAQAPLSGCQTFPCANAYNQPDDIQTQSTPETDLVCLLGTKSDQPITRRHPRDFVTGARI